MPLELCPVGQVVQGVRHVEGIALLYLIRCCEFELSLYGRSELIMLGIVSPRAMVTQTHLFRELDSKEGRGESTWISMARTAGL